MPSLYVAIYRAVHGNYDHWALFLRNGDEEIVYEVTGEHPHFIKHVLESNPERSRRHKKSVLVAEIRPNDVSDLKRVMKEQKVDNETMEWSCQDYVLEALDTLKEKGIIDEDDEEYEEAREQLIDEEYGAK